MNEGERQIPSKRVSEAVEGYHATTIPVQVEIDVAQTILSQPEAEEILKGAEAIALGPCYCRKEAKNCDAPLDVCIAVGGDVAEVIADYEGFRVVSQEEAEEALRISHEAGLVHLAYRKGGTQITQFCSCCSCCCWFLNTLKDYDYHEAIIASNYVVAHDREACVGCGACVDRCHFSAWSTNGDGKPNLVAEKCFGCGVCVMSCPSGAISLIPRSER